MLHQRSLLSRVALPATALLVLLFVAGTVFAQQSGRAIDLNLDFTPSAVAAGDVLGGPEPDIVMTTGNSTPGELAIVINEGPCNSPTLQTVMVVANPTQVLLADLNGDGELDIVARSGLTFSVLLNQRPLTESFARTDYDFAVTISGGEAFARDVDGDGDIDLGMRTQILPNDGSGTFGPSYQLTSPANHEAIGWAWEDFDGDGDIEIAGVTIPFDGTGTFQSVVQVWDSTASDLVFTPSATFNIGPTQAMPQSLDALVTGDFNQDGRMDLIAGVRWNTGGGGQERTIFFGHPSQGLIFGGPGPSAAMAEILRPGQAFDTDGDGHREIIPAYYQTSAVPGPPIAPVDDSTQLSTPINVTPSGLVPSVAPYPAIRGKYAAADFNGDGALDFAVARPVTAPQTLRVIFGGTSPLYELTLRSGSLSEPVITGDSLSASIEFELINCFGNAAADQLIQMTGLPIEASVLGPDPLLTDENGRVAFTIELAAPVPDFEITFFHELSTSLELSVEALPLGTIQLVEDLPGYATVDRRESLQILVTDTATGLPAASAPFEVETSSGIEVLTPDEDLLSDENGMATLEFRPSVAGMGSVEISLTGDPLSAVSSEFFVRGLRVIPIGGGTQAALFYQHESAGVPLILAVDAPLPAPGYVSTMFGRVHTSVLNPQPTLTVLSNEDLPNLQTPLALLTPVPPELSGVELVLQCYGVDGAYVFPDNVFISNPVFVIP